MYQIRQAEKQTRVILEHPDGGLLSVPIRETNFSPPPPSPKIGGMTPLFNPEKLLRLTLLVSTHGATMSEQISLSPEDEEIVERKIDAKTNANAQNRNRRHLSVNKLFAVLTN